MTKQPNYVFDDELYHHGIKGQRWGVRRFQNEDGTYTPEGLERRRIGHEKIDSDSNKLYGTSRKEIMNKKVKDIEFSETEQTKKIMDRSVLMNIGLAVALGNPYALAEIGVKGAAGTIKKNYALNKHSKNDNIDEKTGFKLKNDKKDNYKKDLKAVNPGLNDFMTGTKNNCMLCTTAYELRRRGFDALAGDANYGYNSKDIQKWFPKAKTERADYTPSNPKLHPYVNKIRDDNTSVKDFCSVSRKLNRNFKYKNEMANATLSALSKQNNSRGNLMVRWGDGGGHSMAYEVVDGKVKILDAQTGKEFKGGFAKSLLRKTVDSEFVRLDNVEFNKDEIKKVVRV